MLFCFNQTVAIGFKISREQFFTQCINLVKIHTIFMIWKFSTHKGDPLPQEIVEMIIANARKPETKIYECLLKWH